MELTNKQEDLILAREDEFADAVFERFGIWSEDFGYWFKDEETMERAIKRYEEEFEDE